MANIAFAACDKEEFLPRTDAELRVRGSPAKADALFDRLRRSL
jgi:hypothetical protein